MVVRFTSPRALQVRMSRKYIRSLLVAVSVSALLLFVYAHPERHVRRDAAPEGGLAVNQASSQEQVGSNVLRDHGELC